MTNQHCCPRFMHPTPKTGFEDATAFDLTLVSADNLTCSRRLSRRPIKVHAEVQLDGGAVKKTDADVAGGTNPTWNFDAHYPITDSVHKTGGDLTVRLYYKRSVGHKFIGEVKIRLRDLFDESENAVTYSVEGDPHGRLNISYGFC